MKSPRPLPPPKALIVPVTLKEGLCLEEIKAQAKELEDLVATLGFEVAGSFCQFLTRWNPATLLSTRQTDTIGNIIKESQVQCVIIDPVLSGVQLRNLEKLWPEIKILDRNQVILKIFAQRAQTHEGRLQVELAQLLDQKARQVGAWLGSLSRQGGGMGARRGAGEKALELDRRHLRERIHRLKKKLKKVQDKRKQNRNLRNKNQIPHIALIGYTNSGKSTLMNQLTPAQTSTQDQLFATLDPLTRKLFLPTQDSKIKTPTAQNPNPVIPSHVTQFHPPKAQAVLTDTVGFIHKLPHQLIEAFKATLEEISTADLLLHVIDLSHPRMKNHIQVVEDLIADFQWEEKPIIRIFNKVDQWENHKPWNSLDKVDPNGNSPKRNGPTGMNQVFISAKTGQGLKELRHLILKTLPT